MKKFDLGHYKTVEKLKGEDYELILTVLHGPMYLELKKHWKEFYKNLGYPIPDKGFESELDYSVWENKVYMKKDSVSTVRSILETLNLDVTNRVFKDLVHHDLYFEEKLEEPLFKYLLVSGDDKCYIQIFPWTTQEDILDNFVKIKEQFQSSFKKHYAYQEKRAGKVELLKRNIKLFFLEKDFRSKGYRGEVLYNKIHDSKEFAELKKKYKFTDNFDLAGNMRSINSKFNRMLSRLKVQ